MDWFIWVVRTMPFGGIGRSFEVQANSLPEALRKVEQQFTGKETHHGQETLPQEPGAQGPERGVQAEAPAHEVEGGGR